VARVEAESSGIVVADAGPLIHLDELSSVDLLDDFSRVFVPTAVWKEVEHHRPSALSATILERVEAPPPTPDLLAISRIHTLHRGELEALGICCTAIPSCRLLTDDTAARLAAMALQIPASGTIGMLLRALRRGQRDKHQTLDALASIPERTSLHLRKTLLDEIINEVRCL
jgi:predicted nucleic acid-binding protein